MNFDFIKNGKIDQKNASKFNVFISTLLWLLLIFLLVFLWGANLINTLLGESLYVIWISLCVLEIIFSFIIYKSLILKFSKNKFLTILFSVVIPLIIFLGTTCSFFIWIIANFKIVGGPNIL
jgi:hypothetical protein